MGTRFDATTRVKGNEGTMGMVIGNIAAFAFMPVVIAYFGVLFSTQRSGTYADLKRLVTTFALPIFVTLNTLAVVTLPPTTLTRTFSLLWLAVALVGGCWIEPLFGEAKQWHGMRQFRLRGLMKVNMERLFIAAGQNLKRLLSATGWGRRPWPDGSAGFAGLSPHICFALA